MWLSTPLNVAAVSVVFDCQIVNGPPLSDTEMSYEAMPLPFGSSCPTHSTTNDAADWAGRALTSLVGAVEFADPVVRRKLCLRDAQRIGWWQCDLLRHDTLREGQAPVTDPLVEQGEAPAGQRIA